MRVLLGSLLVGCMTTVVQAASVPELLARCALNDAQIRQVKQMVVGLDGDVALNTIHFALGQIDPADADACFSAVVTDLSHIRTLVGTLPNNSIRRQSRDGGQTDLSLAGVRVELQGIEAVLSGDLSESIAQLTINDARIRVSQTGSFSHRIYIPEDGVVAKLDAQHFDGSTESAVIEIERDRPALPVQLSPIDPPDRQRNDQPSRLALIIGVDGYRDLPTAPFAEKDALSAYQVARKVMGIPAAQIKDLLGVKANEVNIKLALRQWLASQVEPGETELFVFYSGHGLIDAAGETRYWMPYDAHAALLDDTAIRFDEVIETLADLPLKSTVIIADACYTGVTRASEPLTAQRPVRVQRKANALPDNMTLFAASGANQTAFPLQQAEHGLFSYWILRGLSGEADENSDRRLTASELQQFVKTRVTRFSGGAQIPELAGDTEMELVRW